MATKKTPMFENDPNRPRTRAEANALARARWALVKARLHDIIVESRRDQDMHFDGFEIEIFPFGGLLQTCSSLEAYLDYSQNIDPASSRTYVVSIRSVTDRGPSASSSVKAYCVDLILQHFNLARKCRRYMLPILQGNYGVTERAHDLSFLDFQFVREGSSSQWCSGFKKVMTPAHHTSGETLGDTTSNLHPMNFYTSLIIGERHGPQGEDVYILTESTGSRMFSFLPDLIKVMEKSRPPFQKLFSEPVDVRLMFCEWSIKEAVSYLQHLHRTFHDYCDVSNSRSLEIQHRGNLSLLVAQIDAEVLRLRQSHSIITSASQIYRRDLPFFSFHESVNFPLLKYGFEELLYRIDRYLLFAEDLASQVKRNTQEATMRTQFENTERTNQYSLSMLKLSYISQNFSRGNGFLILMFIPGIFVSTLFSTGFFVINDRGTYAVSPTLWIWFAVTIPLTFVSLVFIQVGAILQTLKDQLKVRSANRREQDTEMTVFGSRLPDDTKPGTTETRSAEYAIPPLSKQSSPLHRKSGKRPETSGFSSSV